MCSYASLRPREWTMTTSGISTCLRRGIANRDQSIRIERSLNLLLCFGWAVLIFPRDVQPSRGARFLCLVQSIFNTDAVITNRAVRFESHRIILSIILHRFGEEDHLVATDAA